MTSKLPDELVEAGLVPAVSPVIQLDINQCSNAQIIAWYMKHHDPTVRALVQRLAMAEADKVEAYAQGVAEGLQTATSAAKPEDETRGYY